MPAIVDENVDSAELASAAALSGHAKTKLSPLLPAGYSHSE
jgi:hypothetical protein